MRSETLKHALRRIVESLWPELAHRTHLPHKARVLRVRSEAGVAGPPGSVRYSVDLEPLTPDGRPDPRRPVLRDVPLDVPWAGPGRGVFALPAVGSVVRVAYYDGDPAYPYVDGILPEGQAVPQVEEGEYLLQKDPDTWVRLKADGGVEAQAAPGVVLRLKPDGTAELRGTAVVRVDAPRVELAGGGPAVARVGDPVQVGASIGVIVGGSGKVFSG
ncbi:MULTISPECIES: phage baseplate assembly protein V [Thermus]|uniref:phage baseplate assembly protein V n=1 Tax=Thermus TaxID=270 RepID=UPI001F39F476|nr:MULTISPECIES: phage baseplate assembly protein V [Thermus]